MPGCNCGIDTRLIKLPVISVGPQFARLSDPGYPKSYGVWKPFGLNLITRDKGVPVEYSISFRD